MITILTDGPNDIWGLFTSCFTISADINPHLSKAENILWMVEGNVLSPLNFRLSPKEPSKGSAWPRKETGHDN